LLDLAVNGVLQRARSEQFNPDLRIVEQGLEQLLDGGLNLGNRQTNRGDRAVREMQVPGWINHDLGVIFLVRIESSKDTHAQRVTGGDGGLQLAHDLDVITDRRSGLQRQPFNALDHVQALDHGNRGRRRLEPARTAWVEKTVRLATGTERHAGDDYCKFTVFCIHCIDLLAIFDRRQTHGIHRPDGTQT